jgi:hypothetical protein
VLARLAASDVYTGLNGAPAPFDTLAFVFRHMQVLDVMDGIDDAVLYRLVQATVHPGTVRRLRVRLFGSAVGAPIHAHPGIELALSIIDDMQPSSRGPLPRALQAVSCARLAQSCRLAYPLCKNANVVYAPLDVPLELGDRLQKQVRNRMGYTDDFGVTIVVTGTPELQPELEPEGEEQLDIQTAFLNNIMGVAFDPEAARRVSEWKNNKQISVMSLREYVADHLEDVMFDTGLDGQFTTAEELLAFLT